MPLIITFNNYTSKSFNSFDELFQSKTKFLEISEIEYSNLKLKEIHKDIKKLINLKAFYCDNNINPIF